MIVGVHEQGEVPPELVVALVVVALDRGILDGAVHALDLPVGPQVPWLGQPVFDVELGAGELEGVAEERLVARQHLFDVLGRPAIAAGLGEVGAVVGEHGVDPVGHRRSEGAQEVAGDPARGFLVQLDEGELRSPIDGDEEVELALFCPDLRDIDVKIADRVALELRSPGFVALGVR